MNLRCFILLLLMLSLGSAAAAQTPAQRYVAHVLGAPARELEGLAQDPSEAGIPLSGAEVAHAKTVAGAVLSFKQNLKGAISLIGPGAGFAASQLASKYAQREIEYDETLSEYRRAVLEPMSASDRESLSTGQAGPLYAGAALARVSFRHNVFLLLKAESKVSGKTLRAAARETLTVARDAPTYLTGPLRDAASNVLNVVETEVAKALREIPDSGAETPVVPGASSGGGGAGGGGGSGDAGGGGGGSNDAAPAVDPAVAREAAYQSRLAQELVHQANLDGSVPPVTGQMTVVDYNNRNPDGSPTVTYHPSVPLPTEIDFTTKPAPGVEVPPPATEPEWKPLVPKKDPLTTYSDTDVWKSLQPTPEPLGNLPYSPYPRSETLAEEVKRKLAELRESEKELEPGWKDYINPFWHVRRAKEWTKQKWEGFKNHVDKRAREEFPLFYDDFADKFMGTGK